MSVDVGVREEKIKGGGGGRKHFPEKMFLYFPQNSCRCGGRGWKAVGGEEVKKFRKHKTSNFKTLYISQCLPAPFRTPMVFKEKETMQ